MVYDHRLPPAPSHSRPSPDGHDFPSYVDGSVERSTKLRYSSGGRCHTRSRSRDGANGSRERPSNATSLTRTSSLSSRWRRQDEKSEKSVRDKIAMFSQSKKRTESSRTSPAREGSPMVEVGRGFSEADVRNAAEVVGPGPKLSKTSTFSSMINVSSHTHDPIRSHVKPAASEVNVSQRSNKVASSPTRHAAHESVVNGTESSGLHNRSQSLIDIENTSKGKRHSVGSYDRSGCPPPNTDDRDRRTSLANVVELRKKGLGKLRGIVIPETNQHAEVSSKPPIDLPRIGSSPPPLPNSFPPNTNHRTLSLPRDVQRPHQRLYKTDSISSIESCESNASKQSSTVSSTLSWKTQNSSSMLSRFSPAIKRKNSSGAVGKHDTLPPMGTRNVQSSVLMTEYSSSSTYPSKSAHSDELTTPNSDQSFEWDQRQQSFEKYTLKGVTTNKNSMESSRLNRSEDSDNDSAVSSSQSSFSQGITPPASPVPDSSDIEDNSSGRVSSAKSQSKLQRSQRCSSIDEADSRRILKSGSVDAENRWNVLKSAKCSSGKSSDDSTPELVRRSSVGGKDSFSQKLEHELKDGPPKMKRQSSNDSTCTLVSRRSSGDSRRNSRDTVINLKSDDVSAEQIYINKLGDIYKESEVKVAYVNEISNDFEQVGGSLSNDINNVYGDVITEIPMSEMVLSDQGGIVTKIPTRTPDDKWAKLEQKYGKSYNHGIEAKISKLKNGGEAPVQLTEHNKRMVAEYSVTSGIEGGTGFKALAKKWNRRAGVDESPVNSTSGSPINKSVTVRGDTVTSSKRPNSLQLIPNNGTETTGGPDRKLSMPEFSNSGVRLRERRSEPKNGSGDVPSRPCSLIEHSSDHNALPTAETNSVYLTPSSPAVSGSTDSLDASSNLSRASSKEVLEVFSKTTNKTTTAVNTGNQFVVIGGSRFPSNSSSGSPRVSDIMKAFEIRGSATHNRMSSVDSATSDDGSVGGHYGSVTSLASGTRDQYGSITSLASSTSIISSQVSCLLYLLINL